MITLSHKSKQYLLVALKVLLLAATFGYIYWKLTQTSAQTFSEFVRAFNMENNHLFYAILHFLLLAATNWAFEILKWKTVVSVLERISFWTALKQSLAALTVSLATPNRIGEYGAKAMFYESTKRKQVLLLNFFSNGTQMIITTIFGLFGLWYVRHHFDVSLSTWNSVLLVIMFILFGVLGYFFKEKELLIKGFSVANVWAYFKKMSPSVKIKSILFSVVRYAAFSFLFYNLLHFFGVETTYLEILPILFAMYLLVSIVPTVFVFDVVVRGGVAVWLFSLAGIPELPVLCTVLSMWLLNFVFPAIWGSFYVLKYQPRAQ